jgi:hypothetical protein
VVVESTTLWGSLVLHGRSIGVGVDGIADGKYRYVDEGVVYVHPDTIIVVVVGGACGWSNTLVVGPKVFEFSVVVVKVVDCGERWKWWGGGDAERRCSSL